MNICDFLSASASAKPDFPAIIDGSRALTYAELSDRVLRTAGHLRALGVDAGDRVAVALKDHAEHVVMLFAVARLGATVIPLDWQAPPPERAAMAGRFRAKLTITEESARRPLPAQNIAIDGDWNAGVAAAAAERSYGDCWSLPFVIGLTSGTTGAVKGLPVTHGQAVARYLSLLHHGHLAAGSRFLSALPLCFSAGRMWCLHHLIAGNTVIFYSAPFFHPEGFVSAARKCRATVTLVVPTMLRRLLAAAGEGAHLLGALDALCCGGAAISPQERRAATDRLNPNFFEFFGASGSGVLTISGPDDLAVSEALGRVIYGVQAEIVDDDARPLPAGESGRFRCRGPGVATGYGDSADDEGFEGFRDGWYYTGELAAIDEDGLLHLKGRAADVIIRNGINIYPQEIEAALRSHPAVAEAAVVGQPSDREGEVPVAFIVAAEEPDAKALRAHCRQRLIRYKVPERFIRLDALPKTTSEKVRKADLRASLLAEHLP